MVVNSFIIMKSNKLFKVFFTGFWPAEIYVVNHQGKLTGQSTMYAFPSLLRMSFWFSVSILMIRQTNGLCDLTIDNWKLTYTWRKKNLDILLSCTFRFSAVESIRRVNDLIKITIINTQRMSYEFFVILSPVSNNILWYCCSLLVFSRLFNRICSFRFFLAGESIADTSTSSPDVAGPTSPSSRPDRSAPSPGLLMSMDR